MSSNSYILIREKRIGNGKEVFEVSVRDMENYKMVTDQSDFEDIRSAIVNACELEQWYWESSMPIEYGISFELLDQQDDGRVKRERHKRK